MQYLLTNPSTQHLLTNPSTQYLLTNPTTQQNSQKGASAGSTSPAKKKRSSSKKNNGFSDISNEPIGFERGYEAEEIIGATDLDGQIMFNIKW